VVAAPPLEPPAFFKITRVKALRVAGAILIVVGVAAVATALVASSGSPNCGPGYATSCSPGQFRYFLLTGAGFLAFAIGLVMIVAGSLATASRKRRQQKAEDGQFIQSAPMATGVITGLRDTGETVGNDPRAEITISYTRLDGTPAEVTVSQVVPRLEVPQPGDPATVWYDPSGPKVVANFGDPAWRARRDSNPQPSDP
jgi:Protein of unknown function (DUF3592)